MLNNVKSPLLILYILCLSFFLGLLAATFSPKVGLSPVVLFCFGAAFAPHYIGFCTLLCLLVYRKPSPLLVTVLPAVLCVLAFFLCGLPAVRLPLFFIAGGGNFFATGLGTAFLALLCAHLARNAGQAPYHHDPNTYIANSRYLLENSGKILQVLALKTDQVQYVRTAHGISYEAYLAFARIFLGVLPAWRADTAMHTAFQITVLCYAVALFAAGLYFTGEVWGAIGVIILAFSPPDWRVAINRFTREPYRLIPLIALCTILAVWLAHPLVENTVFIACAAGVLTYLAIDAHAIGAYLTCLTLCIYLGVGLLDPLFSAEQGTWLSRVAVFFACGIGWLAGAFKYLAAYVKTGSLYGSITRWSPFKGRPHWQVLIKANADKYQHLNGISGCLSYVLSKSGYFLLIAGGVCLVFLMQQFFTNEVSSGVFFLCMCCIFFSLPLYKTLLTNMRYTLHCYSFFAIVVIYCAQRIMSMYSLHVIPYVILSIGFVLLSKSSLNWYASFNYQKNIFDTYYSIFNRCAIERRSDQIMLVSNTGYTFSAYFEHCPEYLFATPYWELLQAVDVKDAVEAFRRIKCRFICFTRADITWLHLNSLPFYEALLNNCDVVLKDDRYELWDCRNILGEQGQATTATLRLPLP